MTVTERRPRHEARKAEKGSVEAENRPERLFIGLYRYSSVDGADFTSFLGREGDFTPKVKDYLLRHAKSNLIEVHRIPTYWNSDMQVLMSRIRGQEDPNSPLIRLGGIYFKISDSKLGKVGTTNWYFPKFAFQREELFPCREMDRATPGLGYATEWLALRDLRGSIASVRSTAAPTVKRRWQLEAVGLPIAEPVPIKNWMRRLLSGYWHSARRAHIIASSEE